MSVRVPLSFRKSPPGFLIPVRQPLMLAPTIVPALVYDHDAADQRHITGTLARRAIRWEGRRNGR
jgi:hypothetical protein